MQPTREQIKEFWEWCKLRREDLEHMGDIDKGAGSWPNIDLNNLFKYAVPEAMRKHPFDLELVQLALSPTFCCGLTNEKIDIWVEDEDPALALFWALWQVKESDGKD